MARGSPYGTSRPPKQPRPPSRFTGALLIAFMVVGALAGVAVGLHDINGESTAGKPDPLRRSGLLDPHQRLRHDRPDRRRRARASTRRHICWRDAQRNSAIAGAIILAPFVVVLVYARRRNRSGEEL